MNTFLIKWTKLDFGGRSRTVHAKDAKPIAKTAKGWLGFCRASFLRRYRKSTILGHLVKLNSS